mgnify:CR=1 FL=1
MVKRGFSLAEALVVMVIISIFFAAAAKVFTTRPKPKKQINAHGYYECYGSGSFQQRYVRDGIESPTVSVSKCTFEPPTGIAFFNINSYSPIAHSSFEPNINNTITISINSGISISGDGKQISLSSNGTQDEIRMFLKSLYPDSKLYNGGSILKGIIISW